MSVSQALLWWGGLREQHAILTLRLPHPLPFTSSFIQDRAGRMAGETPELTLEQPPQDASTKKLGECLRRIGDELDNNMELQRCGSWNPGSILGFPAPLKNWALCTLVLPRNRVFHHSPQILRARDRTRVSLHGRPPLALELYPGLLLGGC